MDAKQKHFDYSMLYAKSPGVKFPIVPVLVIILGSMFITAALQVKWAFPLGFVVGLGILLITGIRAAIHAQNVVRDKLLDFATKNNLAYIPLMEQGHEPSTMPNLSSNRELKSVIAGNYKDFSFRMFNNQQVGKNSLGIYVASIDLPYQMPHMVIDSKINGNARFALLPVPYGKEQEIEFEGDFSKYFTVFAPTDNMRDAVLLLAPDVMLALLKSGASSDIEFIENKLYIYIAGDTATDISVIEQMGELVILVLDEVGDKLKRFDTARFGVADSAASISKPSKLRRKTLSLNLIFGGVVFFYYIFSLAVPNQLPFFVPIMYALLWIGMLGRGMYKSYVMDKKQKQLQRDYLDHS